METAKHLGSVMLDNDRITLTGVTRILQNNQKLIAVNQGDRTLTLTGDAFNVTELNLETGRLSATGVVHELKYAGAHEKRDFLKKLFK